MVAWMKRRKLVQSSQHQKSQEVKDGPEGWNDGKDNLSDPENSNSSKQDISIIMRKALAETDKLSENDVKDADPDGWMGTWDMPEEVRRACTTGGTNHLSQIPGGEECSGWLERIYWQG